MAKVVLSKTSSGGPLLVAKIGPPGLILAACNSLIQVSVLYTPLSACTSNIRAPNMDM